MAEHNLFGQMAENEAARFLIAKNYKILERNWRFHKAEIDIIAIDPQTNQIVIAEVKARNINPLLEPEMAVNSKKRKLLISAANEYIVSNEIDLDCRFDIISIERKGEKWEIDHIENAFFSFE